MSHRYLHLDLSQPVTLSGTVDLDAETYAALFAPPRLEAEVIGGPLDGAVFPVTFDPPVADSG